MGYNTNTPNTVSIDFTQLTNQNSQTTTLQHGLNAITTDQASPIKPTFYGRTLVNLGGKEGGFYKVGKWTNTLTIDTSTYKFGSSSGKIDNSSGTNQKGAYNTNKLNLNGKYILIGLWMKSSSGTPTAQFNLDGFNNSEARTTANTNPVSVNTTWGFYYNKYDLTANTDDHWEPFVAVNTYGTANDAVNFDGLFIYEIPKSIYDKIDVSSDYTGSALADKFPYVDSVQHVMNPYLKGYGKNLIPPFTSGKWMINANVKVIDDYALELDATGTYQNSFINVDVVSNTQYSWQIQHNARINIYALDSNGANISTLVSYTTGTSGTVTTPTGTKQLSFILTNSTLGTGTFTFTNPQLELGSTATQFEPMNQSYLYAKEDSNKNPILLASNLDGSVADELYKRDLTWYRLNRFVRDEALTVSNGTSTLSKTPVDGTVIIVDDNDGSIISDFTQSGSTISWNTVPTSPVATYQLAQAVEEVVEVEGSVDLIDGGNQIEVGEGVINREVASPKDNGTSVYINRYYQSDGVTVDNFYSSNNLKNKVDKIIDVYKNGVLDEGWIHQSLPQAYGKDMISKPSSQYDSTAEYTVSYVALDLYKLSSAENNVNVEYQKNMKMTVDELVQRNEDNETQISINKNAIVDIYARLKAGGL